MVRPYSAKGIIVRNLIVLRGEIEKMDNNPLWVLVLNQIIQQINSELENIPSK